MNLQMAKTLDRTVGAATTWCLDFLTRRRAFFRARPEVGRVRTILVIKLWGMGNIVLLYPVIEELRKRYPDSRIHFLTLRQNRSFVERHPAIDTVFSLDIGSWPRLLPSLAKLIVRVRRADADLLLDFEQFCHLSGIVTALSKARQTIGYQLPGVHRGQIYNVRVPYREERHMGEIFADISRAAGVEPFRYRLIPVPVQPDERSEGARAIAEWGDKTLVTIHAGSGDNFPGRRWPSESFTALSRALLESGQDVRLLYTGVRAERQLVESIRRPLGPLADRTRDLTGQTTPGGLAEVLRRSSLLVSNDTGPVHLGGAMGTPVFAFYGPNTPVLYGPLGPNARSFYLDLPCSPCITNINGKTSSCRMPVCMRQISVEMVMDQIRRSGVLHPGNRGVLAPSPGDARS